MMAISKGEQYANALHECLAPCKFCGYEGEGYYQRHTHKLGCKWFEVGGMQERAKVLMNEQDMKKTNLIISGEDGMRTLPFSEDDAVISIVSPGRSHPQRLTNHQKTLRIQFHDLNPWGIKEKEREEEWNKYHAK